jgi:UDP-glucose 4-epimerase
LKILVTGGAGYIGSHVVKALGKKKHDLIIFDNLSTGHKEAVTYGELVIGDLSHKEKIEQLIASEKFDAVLHFAGSIVVPESVSHPLKYYQNNTLNSFSLISLCQKYNVKNFIFSSTAAVYGIPESGYCSEESPLLPINPYGASKLMTEQMLSDVSKSSDLKYVALRYFNVSVADPDGEIGQSFPEATHLIKVASEVASGKRELIKIYGTDYPTPDGTCIRDYIHVTDLADAHVRALEYLEDGGGSSVFNCGYGHGFSVKEVLDRVKKISGINIKIENAPRRPGDPASLTAKAEKIKEVLNWKPQFDNLDFIIETALRWEINKNY